jgi:hypothetical protein
MREPSDDQSLTVTRIKRHRRLGEPAVEAWFATGGRVRVRRTPEGGIEEEVWRPTDSHSVYDGYEAVAPWDADNVTVDECLTVLLERLTEPNLDTDDVIYQALTHQPEDR